MKKLLLLALLGGSVAVGAPAANACHTERPHSPRCWTEHHCEVAQAAIVVEDLCGIIFEIGEP